MIGDSYDTILTHQTPHPGHVKLVYCIAEKNYPHLQNAKRHYAKCLIFRGT